jgi:hypothetical protein
VSQALDDLRLQLARERRGDDRRDVEVAAPGVVAAERVGAPAVDADEIRAEDGSQPGADLGEIGVDLGHRALTASVCRTALEPWAGRPAHQSSGTI